MLSLFKNYYYSFVKPLYSYHSKSFRNCTAHNCTAHNVWIFPHGRTVVGDGNVEISRAIS